MNALRFWLSVAGWSLAALAEIPLQAVLRAFDTTDVHDVFGSDDD